MQTNEKRMGLIINPISGIGGSVSLKGSDGTAIQERARAMGAVPRAQERVGEALKPLLPFPGEFELITYPGEMGADTAVSCGFKPTVIGNIIPGKTTAADTQQAAQEMLAMGADLLLFAGGDGTARDIVSAVGTRMPVLGIPTGVKIYSAVYATNPRSAGELAALYLQGKAKELLEAEVVDIDEEDVRQGAVSVILFGYLKIPYRRALVQSLKSASPPSEQYSTGAIAATIVEQMIPNWLYILGPGTTTRAITDRLGLAKTLIGVDVLKDKQILASDVTEKELLGLLDQHLAKIIVTPIGGQGYIFGRGNQQISAEVIRRVGKENILVVSTKDKIVTLRRQPLLVDTGSPTVDRLLSGFLKVVTGYNEYTIYRVSS